MNIYNQWYDAELDDHLYLDQLSCYFYQAVYCKGFVLNKILSFDFHSSSQNINAAKCKSFRVYSERARKVVDNQFWNWFNNLKKTLKFTVPVKCYLDNSLTHYVYYVIQKAISTIYKCFFPQKTKLLSQFSVNVHLLWRLSDTANWHGLGDLVCWRWAWPCCGVWHV